MADFKVKTRGDARPDGKPRVYLTCHPADEDPWAGKLVSDLLRAADCAIYLCADMAHDPGDDADWEVDLGRMQLLAVPVTYRLLTEPSRAMDADVPFALGRGIPVLPVVVEDGLDVLYTRRFGELQYLSPRGDGRGGGVGYAARLASYLETVLVGEEQAARIRDAFDAYVFLSYRKVDRRLADDFMRMVHADERCRGIALWYDEFLTPGESFRDNIARALSDSALFALLVTPNVVEHPGGEPNFVMGEEYPAAKRAGLGTVAVEAAETDRAALEAAFGGLPSPYRLWDEEDRSRLLDTIARLATDTGGDPLHDYLVGLAYLKGIDVEADAARGAALVEQAAEAGLLEATAKLAGMYKSGDGVRLDYEEAARWAERLYEQVKVVFGDVHLNTLAELSDLSVHYANRGDYRRALKLGEEAYRLTREVLGQVHPRTLTALNNLAVRHADCGDCRQALELGEEAYRLRREAFGEEHPDTLSSLSNLAFFYGCLGDYRRALKLGEEAYQLRREALGREHPDTLASLNNLAACCSELGDYRRALKLADEVYQLTRESLGDAHPSTLTSLSNLVACHFKLGDYRGALDLAEEAYQLKREVLGEEHPGTFASLSDLAACHSELGDRRRALELGEEAFQLRRKVLGERHPVTINSLSNLASYHSGLGDDRKAKDLSEEAYQLAKEVLGESHPDTLAALSNLASFYSVLDDHRGALELAEEAYRLRKKVLGEEHPATLASLQQLVSYCGSLGDYRRALELAEELYRLQREILGEEHPATLASLNLLALLNG